jgi:hypothetical protein
MKMMEYILKLKPLSLMHRHVTEVACPKQNTSIYICPLKHMVQILRTVKIRFREHVQAVLKNNDHCITFRTYR